MRDFTFLLLVLAIPPLRIYVEFIPHLTATKLQAVQRDLEKN
jgi:hypothetical protein